MLALPARQGGSSPRQERVTQRRLRSPVSLQAASDARRTRAAVGENDQHEQRTSRVENVSSRFTEDRTGGSFHVERTARPVHQPQLNGAAGSSAREARRSAAHHRRKGAEAARRREAPADDGGRRLTTRRR